LLNLSEIGRGGCPILQAVNRSPLYACSWCDNTQLQAVPATNHRHIVYTSRMQPINLGYTAAIDRLLSTRNTYWTWHQHSRF